MNTSMRAGFTLIELLVVISVIAVLATMLLPTINLVRDNARRTVCASQMRQVGMALVAYRTDNESAYPTTFWADGNWNTWSSWTYQTTTGRWQHALEAFIGSYKVFNCPSAVRFYPNAAVRDVGTATVPRGTAPANGVGTWGTCIMAYNTAVYGPNPQPNSSPSSFVGNRTDAKIDSVFAGTGYLRTRCPVIFDGVWQNDGSNQQNNTWGCYFPHRLLKTNMIFGDGHVEVHAKDAFTSYSPVQVRE